jgi:hypothetical protein
VPHYADSSDVKSLTIANCCTINFQGLRFHLIHRNPWVTPHGAAKRSPLHIGFSSSIDSPNDLLRGEDWFFQSSLPPL